MDKQPILDIMHGMIHARIGKHKKWKKMATKVAKDIPLNPAEQEYYSRMTRIYKNGTINTNSRKYHIKIPIHDKVSSRCYTCGDTSEYYCTMNDQYFCQIHITGHDMNEF